MKTPFLIFVALVTFGNASSSRILEQKIMNSILDPTKYDSRIQAFGPNKTDTGATKVSVNLFVRSIEALDEVNMNFKVQLTFRMQWLDTRLEFSQMKTINLPYVTLMTNSDIWTPDLFFSNEKEGHAHSLLKPNTYTRIFPDGQVIQSTRISLTLSCPMDFKLFPMDKQTCSLRMASNSFTTADLIFVWKADDPVQITSNLHLPEFALQNFKTDYCDSHTGTGVYSCLRVDFVFKRGFSYYLIHVYIPSTTMVILAWLSFWINAKQTLGRILISLMALLFLEIDTCAFNSRLSVSYTRAIDVWTGVCRTFAFSAVCLCVAVSYFMADDKKMKTENEEGTLNKSVMEMEEREKDNGKIKWKDLGLVRGVLKMPLVTKIDTSARIVYPILFILFNLAYWVTYSAEPAMDRQ